MFGLLGESGFVRILLALRDTSCKQLGVPAFPQPPSWTLCPPTVLQELQHWPSWIMIFFWSNWIMKKRRIFRGAGSTSTPSPLSLIVQQISCVENHHGRPLADIHSDSNNLIITSLPLNPSNARSVCHVCFTTWNYCIYEIFKGGVYNFLNFFMRLVGQNIWW